jgi:peptide-methionine (R)-S-oxide reductase
LLHWYETTLLITVLTSLLLSVTAQSNESMINKAPDQFPLEKTEQQWKEQLTPQEYYVIREKGTERPYTGEYNMHFEEGTYTCRALRRPTVHLRFKI